MAYRKKDRTKHDEICAAFIRAEPRIKGKKMCKRHGELGYTHIHGPNHPADETARQCPDHCMTVEKQNGTVGFSKTLSDKLDGSPRDGKPISEQYPMGYSCGPVYGNFGYGLTYSDIEQRGIDNFVQDFIKCCESLGIW